MRGSEAGSYLRLIDCVYHSTLGLRVVKKREEGADLEAGVHVCDLLFFFVITLMPGVFSSLFFLVITLKPRVE